MDLSWWDRWVGPTSRHVGLTLSTRQHEGQRVVLWSLQSSFLSERREDAATQYEDVFLTIYLSSAAHPNVCAEALIWVIYEL